MDDRSQVAPVEVLERPDGRLLVEYKGRMIPTQEAPHVPASCVCSVRLPASTVAPMAPAITTRSKGAAVLAALESRGINDAKSNRSPAERASMQLRCLGSQPRAKWLCGRRYRRPTPVACPSVGSRGSWVSIGTPPASTRQPRGIPSARDGIAQHPSGATRYYEQQCPCKMRAWLAQATVRAR